MRKKWMLYIILSSAVLISGCSSTETGETAEADLDQIDELSDDELEAMVEERIEELDNDTVETEKSTSNFSVEDADYFQVPSDQSHEAVIRNVKEADGYYVADADISTPILIPSEEIDSLNIGDNYRFPDSMTLQYNESGKTEILPESGIELEYILDDGEYKYFTDIGTDPAGFSVNENWDYVEELYRLSKCDNGYLLEVKYMNTMPGEFFCKNSYSQNVSLIISPSATIKYYDVSKGFPEYGNYDECAFKDFFNTDATSCWSEQMGLDTWRGLYEFVSVQSDADGILIEIADGFPAG